MSVDIELNLLRHDLQVRAAMHGVTVDTYRDLMEAGTALPPVVVYVDTEGEHWLADGFHRLEAARRLGRAHIVADVRQGSRDEALWFAMGANREHGLRMTGDDIRQAVRLALKAWPSKSQQQIAQQVGCSQSLVSTVKTGVIARDNTALPETRVDSMGRTQPTAKPRATPAPAPAPAPAAVVEEIAETEAPKPAPTVVEERVEQPAADEAPAPAAAKLDDPWSKSAINRLLTEKKNPERLARLMAIRDWLEQEIARTRRKQKQIEATAREVAARRERLPQEASR